MADETTNSMTSAEAADLLKRMKAIASDLWREPPEEVAASPKEPKEKPEKKALRKPEITIDNLWMTADESIDWTDALAHEWPTDRLTSIPLWRFYHEQAEKVLSGDLAAYAEVLRKANPLGELVTFAGEIQMRAPDPERLEATFTALDEYTEGDAKKYLSAMGIRIARDLLACLPVSEVQVTAMYQGRQVMQVVYRRDQLLHRNFRFLDPLKLTEECGAEFGVE